MNAEVSQNPQTPRSPLENTPIIRAEDQFRAYLSMLAAVQANSGEADSGINLKPLLDSSTLSFYIDASSARVLIAWNESIPLIDSELCGPGDKPVQREIFKPGENMYLCLSIRYKETTRNKAWGQLAEVVLIHVKQLPADHTTEIPQSINPLSISFTQYANGPSLLLETEMPALHIEASKLLPKNPCFYELKGRLAIAFRCNLRDSRLELEQLNASAARWNVTMKAVAEQAIEFSVPAPTETDYHTLKYLMTFLRDEQQTIIAASQKAS